jgi:hypothetical protein
VRECSGLGRCRGGALLEIDRRTGRREGPCRVRSPAEWGLRCQLVLTEGCFEGRLLLIGERRFTPRQDRTKVYGVVRNGNPSQPKTSANLPPTPKTPRPFPSPRLPVLSSPAAVANHPPQTQAPPPTPKRLGPSRLPVLSSPAAVAPHQGRRLTPPAPRGAPRGLRSGSAATRTPARSDRRLPPAAPSGPPRLGG